MFVVLKSMNISWKLCGTYLAVLVLGTLTLIQSCEFVACQLQIQTYVTINQGFVGIEASFISNKNMHLITINWNIKFMINHIVHKIK